MIVFSVALIYHYVEPPAGFDDHSFPVRAILSQLGDSDVGCSARCECKEATGIR